MNWKNLAIYTLKIFFFWLVFFQAGRIVFIIYHANKIFDNSLLEVLKIFPYSLRLDVSSACYIMGLPVVLIFLMSLHWAKYINIFLKYYCYFIIVCISAITVFELDLYTEWGVKLNYKAIVYLEHPSEAFNTLPLSKILMLFVLFFAFVSISIYSFNKLVYTKIAHYKRNWFFPLPFLFLGALGVGVGLRGGLQQIPINQSECYFSNNNNLNIAATNSFWNFSNSIYQNWEIDTRHNPYQYYPDAEAQAVLRELHAVEKDTTIHIFNVEKPNIVFVILESWSADLVKYCGGDSGIAPVFESLSDDGYLFTKCFATGERSDQGMAAIWSAFPSQPLHSIISQPDKFQHLPSMVNNFKQAGYYTSYIFGGQLIYGNIKGYMMSNKFDKIKEGKDFPGYPEGRLGIHDGYMFNELLKECNTSKQPFFNSLFTLSTHNPYDMPCANPITKGGDEKPYLNSAYYTDSCIGAFIKEAKKQPWYKNTLFVFMADHSHNTPQHTDLVPSTHHSIPFLLYGDVIKKEYRGYKHTKVASQVDIAATLLAQLNMKHDEFTWSKNLLNPYTQEFAYMVFSWDGDTWVRPWGELSVHHGDGNRLFNIQVSDSSKIEQMGKEAKCYMQEVFRQYLVK